MPSTKPPTAGSQPEARRPPPPPWRDEQAPHRGGDHHPGGKAQKDTLDGRIELLSEQKDQGGPEWSSKVKPVPVAAHKMDCMSSLLFLVSHS